LKELIKKYSEFINLPINLLTWKDVDKEVKVDGEYEVKDGENV